MRENMLFSREICTAGKKNPRKSSLMFHSNPNIDIFVLLAGSVVNNTSERTSYFFYFELWLEDNLYTDLWLFVMII